MLLVHLYTLIQHYVRPIEVHPQLNIVVYKLFQKREIEMKIIRTYCLYFFSRPFALLDLATSRINLKAETTLTSR